LGIKCAKCYSYPFKFDIFIAQCLGGLFFTGYSVQISLTVIFVICKSTTKLLHKQILDNVT